jgi:hypothetical protein
MADHWNKATKRYSPRGHTPALLEDPDEIVRPMMNDGRTMRQAIAEGLNPRLCKAIMGTVYPMTENEIAVAKAAAETARQAAKPTELKAAENEYLSLLGAVADPTTLSEMGLAEVPRSYREGLGEYLMHVSDALAATGDLVSYHAVNVATQRLAWLGNNGVNAADIPDGGHEV